MQRRRADVQSSGENPVAAPRTVLQFLQQSREFPGLRRRHFGVPPPGPSQNSVPGTWNLPRSQYAQAFQHPQWAVRRCGRNPPPRNLWTHRSDHRDNAVRLHFRIDRVDALAIGVVIVSTAIVMVLIFHT
ncbi:hypothetical protein GCM10010433_66510 [Streptomyces pulveraceus]